MTVLRIVRDSWNTLRQNRILWFFGFFVAGAGGSGVRFSHHTGGGSVTWLPVALAAAAIVALAVIASGHLRSRIDRRRTPDRAR